MLTYWLILSVLLALSQVHGSFLKCSASDSLESLDDLDSDERVEKQGYVCDEWPFYAGGFPAHSSSSSSSSSSESGSRDDDDDDHHSKESKARSGSGSGSEDHDDDASGESGEGRHAAWKRSDVGSAELDDYDDTLISSKCIDIHLNGYCQRWLTMKLEKREEGCDDSSSEDKEPKKEFEVCICANGDNYCETWACLEIEDLKEEMSSDMDDIEEAHNENMHIDPSSLSLPIYSLYPCGNEEDHKESDNGCGGHKGGHGGRGGSHGSGSESHDDDDHSSEEHDTEGDDIEDDTEVEDTEDDTEGDMEDDDGVRRLRSGSHSGSGSGSGSGSHSGSHSGSGSSEEGGEGHRSAARAHEHYCFTEGIEWESDSEDNGNRTYEVDVMEERIDSDDSGSHEQVRGEFRNCWCNTASDDGMSCMNWYCESFEKNTKTVDDHGWFGCFPDKDESMIEGLLEDMNLTHTSHCNAWYGFMQDIEEREEYRCVCDEGIECLSWHCGVNEYELRRNEMWYNFYLALFLWAFLFGCFGTCCCYRCNCRSKKCDDERCEKYDAFITRCQSENKCKVIRMTVFYMIVGFAAIAHGGVPCFLFFVIFASIAQCCAIKRENCKCKCSRRCGNSNKAVITVGGPTTNATTINGENSKESSSDGNDNTTVKMVRIPSEESIDESV